MSNIVGEGFAREIREQVNKRQEIYGSINRSNEQLQYLNANTGWVRLASSVDINAKIREFPDNLRSNNLAKQYVLFGGIQGVQGTNFNNIHNSAFNTEAYGIGGTEFGIRPMPGIKSAQIKTLTRGSLKEATVQITANNRTQFDIIDILYLRLGFTMLLEWGHASYFPNTGDFVENNPFGIYTGFLEGFYSYNDVLDIIQDSRIKSNGNYDAIAGKVVNFNWKYNRDGSYSITLILRSLGDVIESLKANILLGDKEAQYSGPPLLNIAPAPQKLNLNIAGLNQSTQTQIPLKSLEPIEPAKIANEIDRLFYNLKRIIDNTSFSKKDNLMKIVKDNGEVNYFGQGYSSSDNINYYIRLGYFLKWIERNLVPYVNNDENSRLIKFDTNTETNLIYLDSLQISADPRICTFNRTFDAVGSNGEKFGTTTFSGEAELFEIQKGTTFSYGKIMNAYFNMNYISDIVKNLQSTDTGNIVILDLIRALCNGWNQATGRINRLDITVDPDTNKCRIIDETSIPGKDKSILFNNLSLPVETAKFLTYRSLPGTGSTFLKNIDFTTQIPHNFATLITIGSTAQGYVLGADATALSRMNAGLTDRTKTTISSPGSKDKQDISLEEKYKSALEAFNAFKLKLSFFENRGSSDPPAWDQQSIETFSSLQSQLVEYKQALQVAKNQTTAPNASSPNMGFLPFNLSLTMDGLSGMKVYQKFEVDTDFLPSNYPTSLDFIIKGITHTIQNNEWITNIESFAIPANPFGTELGQIVQQQRASRNLITNVNGFNQELIKQAVKFFKNQGFPDTSVAGIVGNLLVESGLNTNAVGDGGKAYGIAQWRGSRLTDLRKKYPGPTNSYATLNSQLNWIIDELNDKESRAKIALSKTSSAEQAAEIFDSTYERSNGASREQRKLYAKDIYNKILANAYK